MRVVGGTRKSLPLKAPKGIDTRPTEDRTKETLFNVLQNEISGSQFLDLFSGSGQIGIEALSRGAEEVILVEQGREALECIKENLIFTKFIDAAKVMECDVILALEKLRGHKPFDIIFIDPPYMAGLENSVFNSLSSKDYVDEYTTIILEASLKLELDFIENNGFEIIKQKKYKTNQHIFIKKN